MPAKSKKKRSAIKTSRPVTKRRAEHKKRAFGRQSSARSVVLPAFVSFCLLICLGAIGFLGYRSVTASNFFGLASIDVRGTERASSKDIERIVSNQALQSGVWNADLAVIKQKIEKLRFVKSAAVSQVLPNGLRVDVRERAPKAIIRLSDGDFLVDGEGEVLAPVEGNEENLPYAMTGWDETKSEKANKENIERVKMYQKMLAEWKDFGLAGRVQMVNLADLRQPRAITEDSGTTVSIDVGREEFGQHLSNGIKAIVGKGATFEAVTLNGTNMILAPRKGR